MWHALCSVCLYASFFNSVYSLIHTGGTRGEANQCPHYTLGALRSRKVPTIVPERSAVPGQHYTVGLENPTLYSGCLEIRESTHHSSREKCCPRAVVCLLIVT